MSTGLRLIAVYHFARRHARLRLRCVPNRDLPRRPCAATDDGIRLDSRLAFLAGGREDRHI